jgi:hypothetical protein
MGDWATTHHWFECESPARAYEVLGRLRRVARHYSWTDRERWALRAGLCAPRVVLAASLTKYGAELGLAAQVCEGLPGLHTLQVCADYAIWSADVGLRVLGPRFNYVYLPRRISGTEVLEWVGDDVRLVQFGEASVLCLRGPAELPGGGSGRVAELLASELTLARLVEGLMLSAGGSLRVQMVLGWRTPEHGWLHLASLALHLGGRAHEDEYDLRHDGAARQPVTEGLCVGPMAGSIYFEREPALDLSRADWPFV